MHGASAAQKSLFTFLLLLLGNHHFFPSDDVYRRGAFNSSTNVSLCVTLYCKLRPCSILSFWRRRKSAYDKKILKKDSNFCQMLNKFSKNCHSYDKSGHIVLNRTKLSIFFIKCSSYKCPRYSKLSFGSRVNTLFWEMIKVHLQDLHLGWIQRKFLTQNLMSFGLVSS